MDELRIARLLTALGTEVALASETAAQAAKMNAQAIQLLADVNVRIQGIVNSLLVEEADVVEAIAGAGATAVPDPVDPAEPEPVAADPEKVEAVAAPPLDPSPLVRPAVYEEVLNRFAVTGGDHNELAQEFGVRVGIISKCLDTARRSGDARVSQGDLKRVEAVDADAGPGMPNAATMATIEPAPDEVGNVLATVAYTDGAVVRADTGDHVRMKGPGLRIVALLKDQRFYSVAEVKAASRYTSDAVFRSNLIDVQRALAQIGLHIVEDAHEGFQLRKIDRRQARTAA